SLRMIRLNLVPLLCLLLLIGCSSVDKKNPDGEGYIFQISNNRALILNNVDPSDIGKEWNEIYDSYQGDAIWLTTNKSNLKIGQYVKYWIYGNVGNSFPQLASAKK